MVYQLHEDVHTKPGRRMLEEFVMVGIDVEFADAEDEVRCERRWVERNDVDHLFSKGDS